MYKNASTDPRFIRSRNSFQNAFENLLGTCPFKKITISMIAEKAGYARHTFYNHFDTKEDLLTSFIDSILDELFSRITPLEILSRDGEGDQKTGIKFFEIWLPHAEIVRKLIGADFDALLIERLKIHFITFYHRLVVQEVPGMGDEMAKYLVSYLAYSLTGVLKEWIYDDMRVSPEVMGRFINHFAGIEAVNTAINKFKDVIR